MSGERRAGNRRKISIPPINKVGKHISGNVVGNVEAVSAFIGRYRHRILVGRNGPLSRLRERSISRNNREFLDEGGVAGILVEIDGVNESSRLRLSGDVNGHIGLADIAAIVPGLNHSIVSARLKIDIGVELAAGAGECLYTRSGVDAHGEDALRACRADRRSNVIHGASHGRSFSGGSDEDNRIGGKSDVAESESKEKDGQDPNTESLHKSLACRLCGSEMRWKVGRLPRRTRALGIKPCHDGAMSGLLDGRESRFASAVVAL